jgi:hypothetical protein
VDVDDDVVVDSISTEGILSLLALDSNTNSLSPQGISSMVCLGVDVTLIRDGELNIFGGESNVVVECIATDEFNI